MRIGTVHWIFIVHESFCIDLASRFLNLNLLVRIYCAHKLILSPVVHFVPDFSTSSNDAFQILGISQELLDTIKDGNDRGDTDEKHSDVEHVFTSVE